MALPGHSPPPSSFGGPGSPPRSLNGYSDAHGQYPTHGPQPRPMPPPSPHNFAPPRYSQGPPPPPPPSAAINYQNDTRGPPLPHKRPGSSMSISSMLGSEPEKVLQPHHEAYYQRAPARPHSTTGPSMSLGAVMSPPQYPPRPAAPEYSYKPRSRTPDRLNEHLGTRPYRSSSGSLLQRPALFHDHDHANGIDPQLQAGFGSLTSAIVPGHSPHNAEAVERARRTSISGILQRPESELVRPLLTNHFPQDTSKSFRPEYPAPAPTNPASFGPPIAAPRAERPRGLTGSYDTRPPALSNQSRPSVPSLTNRRNSNSRSPELRRSQANGTDPRSLASLLNSGPENMHRQDSEQSRSSAFGDRNRPRAFSPFAGSAASHTMSSTSVAADDQARKGSDELSQHRAVLAVAADAKRGRYSPVPQAVQGAQAQTPVPDAGIKSEHGRVFAGLGGGLGSSSGGPTSTPGALAASPFKQHDAVRLSEENLMKISRSTSGINKRARKYDEDIRAESDTGDGKKPGSRKKTKYAHSYKIDIEHEVNRRSTPLSALNGIRPAGTPTNSVSQGLHHHQLQRQPAAEPVPLFKPKKTVNLSSVMTIAKRHSRRHLGNFTYDPEVVSPNAPRPGFEKFDVSVKPNLLPSFIESEQLNCTYSVRVPRMWLQERERGLICKESFFWGSGIYTDDSDVVAAAMHSGYLESQAPSNVDKVLLSRVVREHNAKIEGLLNLPDTPIQPEPGKDAIITLVVLPALDQYVSSSRFGMTSRDWPEKGSRTPHDGVSFAILKVDFVTGGVEGRRMGRTGIEKRKRMRREQRERLQSQLLLKRMVEQARKKLKEQGKLRKNVHPLSVAHNVSDELKRELGTTDVTVLDVGHAPEEWLKKVEAETA